MSQKRRTFMGQILTGGIGLGIGYFVGAKKEKS